MALLVNSRRRVRARHAAGGGGGTTPAELGVIDFQNGVYTVGGVSTTVGAMVAGFSGTVTPGTGLTTNGQWALQGAMLAAVTAGATVVIDMTNVGHTEEQLSYAGISMEWSDDEINWTTDYLIGTTVIRDYNAGLLYTFTEDGAENVKVALTVVPGTRLSFSRSGGSVHAITGLTLGSAIGVIGFNAATFGGAIRSVKFYEPYPDADLPALSALT